MSDNLIEYLRMLGMGVTDKAADEIASLRERLEQAERAGFRAGTEAASELAKWHSDTLVDRIRALSPAPSTDKPCNTCKGTGYTDAVIDDRCGRCNETGVEPDNTTPYCWACHYAGDCGCKSSDTTPSVAKAYPKSWGPMRKCLHCGEQTSAKFDPCTWCGIWHSRALAAQKGE